MAARISVEFAQSAQDDLRDMMAWYASQDVAEVGRRLAAEIIDRVRQLEAFPDSGRVVPEFDTTWLRELEHPPFRIVYRRDESVVTIEPMKLAVVTAEGADSGRTAQADDGTEIRVATTADRAAFEQRFLAAPRAGASQRLG